MLGAVFPSLVGFIPCLIIAEVQHWIVAVVASTAIIVPILVRTQGNEFQAIFARYAFAFSITEPLVVLSTYIVKVRRS